MMGCDSLSVSMKDHQRCFSSMSCLSSSTSISLTSVAGLWLTSVSAGFEGSAVVPASVVTAWISRISDALAGCLTKTSQPDLFPFQVPSPVCHAPNFKQTVTDMTASSAYGFIFAYRAWRDPAPNGLKFRLNCFRRRRRESLWRNEDSGQGLTCCQSTLGARRPYCTAVTPSGEYSAGRRWVPVLHVGDIITAWAVTPRDAKLNQADSPAAPGSSEVYSY